MKHLLYILLIVTGSGLASCKDYLEEVPRHALTDANAITDFNKAKAAVSGIYATFQNESWAGGLYAALATKSGFVTFTGTADNQLSYSQLNGGNAAVWTQFYRSLNAANFAIKGIPALPASAVPNEGEREALLAEARCMRAWINANILWNFGHWWGDDNDEAGLLHRDQPVGLSNVSQARISVGESYAKIYEDLDFAIEKAKGFTTPRYASKEFAKALKAKLLLYRGGYRNTQADLTEALKLVNEVLTAPATAIGIEPSLAAHYDKAWDSKENLFVRYLENDGTRTSKGGYWYTYGIIYQGNTLPLAVGATETAGIQYGLDWMKADPRWSVITGPVRAPETWDNTFRFTFKKLARLGSYAGKLANPIDEKYAAYYFRYSELFLMKAELLARTGASIADAIAPVNALRAQRTAPVLPALNPSSQQELMDMLFKEIVMELFLENGSEFFASLRFKDSGGKPWIVAIKNGRELVENRICWPIPDGEMINNPLMAQNPDLK